MEREMLTGNKSPSDRGMEANGTDADDDVDCTSGQRLHFPISDAALASLGLDPSWRSLLSTTEPPKKRSRPSLQPVSLEEERVPRIPGETSERSLPPAATALPATRAWILDASSTRTAPKEHVTPSHQRHRSASSSASQKTRTMSELDRHPDPEM